MKAQIIQIGNSAGVILPKALLELYNLKPKTKVSISQIEGSIVIKPEPRANWEAKFEQYAAEGEDKLMPDFFEDETNEEWQW